MERKNFRLMAEELLDRIFELPADVQLGILRTLAPRVLGPMTEEQRAGFLRDLDLEIADVERGERAYDLRPGLSHDHPHRG